MSTIDRFIVGTIAIPSVLLLVAGAAFTSGETLQLRLVLVSVSAAILMAAWGAAHLDSLNSRISTDGATIQMRSWFGRKAALRVCESTLISRFTRDRHDAYLVTDGSATTRFIVSRNDQNFAKGLAEATGLEVATEPVRNTLIAFSPTLGLASLIWTLAIGLAEEQLRREGWALNSSPLLRILDCSLMTAMFMILSFGDDLAPDLLIAGNYLLSMTPFRRQVTLKIASIKSLTLVRRPLYSKIIVGSSERTLTFMSFPKRAKVFCEALESRSGLSLN